MSNALTFNGTDEYAHMDSFAGLVGTDYTIEMWIKPATGHDSLMVAAELYNGSNDTFEFTLSSGEFFSEFEYTLNEAETNTSNGAETVNTWQHIAAVFSTTLARTIIYKNGTPWITNSVFQAPTGSLESQTGNEVYLASYEGAFEFFAGDIGGFFRVWKRALTFAEIYANYDKQLDAASEGDATLTVNCNFTEGSGTVVDNDATAGEDLDLVNTPTWTTGPTLTAKSYVNTYRYGQVSASGDDAEENRESSPGTVDLTSSDIEIVDDSGSDQMIGLRFPSMAIPNGATIEAAYVRFVGDEAESAGTINVTISGEDVDDSAIFTTAGSNVSGRTKTTANVAWNAIPASTVNGFATTPDIKTIIQEIVDRAGWATGNDLSIIIENNGTADSVQRTYNSWDQFRAGAAALHVEYTEAAPGGDVVKDIILPVGVVPFAR